MNGKNSVEVIWRKRATRALALVFLLGILISTTGLCSAAEVWSDNFDDCNCEGWTIDSCSAADGTLRSLSTGGFACRESSITEGTWSFDLELKEYVSGPELGFEMGAVTPTVFFMSTHPEETPWYFYSVYSTLVYTQTGTKPILEIRKNNANGGGAFTTWVKLASYDLEEDDFGWKHIDVARTAGGQITVWLNGTMVMQAVDNEISTSEYFVFMANEDMAIDNIVLDDVPRFAGITVELLAVGAVVSLVIVASILWVWRRRG
ncbi:hypothetical protein EU522_01215 [Candidatus Thorarchaeota archaeon]|nr:MAG: hypothetical protein EU522_01215 [Candidatus Thorarchaeota archaeon]